MVPQVTITIDEEVDRGVRECQARKMLERNKACSYSADKGCLGIGKRVTITIDDELDRGVREHRARKMLERNKAYSCSAAMNDLLASGA